MTEPRRSPFDLSIAAIKEFACSFTGSNPGWADDQQEDELNPDFMDKVPDSADVIFDDGLPPIDSDDPGVKEFTDLMQGIVDSEETSPNEDVLLSDPANYSETKRAKGELATAKMVRDQEAFVLRINHESLDTLWEIISSAIVNGVGPNRAKIGDPRYGRFNSNAIDQDIHDVIESMQEALSTQLQEALYDYDSASTDVDIAEFEVRHGTKPWDVDHLQPAISRTCGVDNYDDTVYGEGDIEMDPIDFDEGYNDYEWRNEDGVLQCLETSDEVNK